MTDATPMTAEELAVAERLHHGSVDHLVRRLLATVRLWQALAQQRQDTIDNARAALGSQSEAVALEGLRVAMFGPEGGV